MNQFNLTSRGKGWTRLFPVNLAAASTAFVAGGLVEKPISVSVPNPFADAANLKLLSDGIIPTAGAPGFSVGEETPNAYEFQLFGTDTENQTLSIRIWGITQGFGLVSSTMTRTWKPTLLAEVQGTLGSSACNGVALGLVEAADFYCDIYSITSGNPADVGLNNTANVKGASFRVDTLGYPIIACELDDGASAVTVNGLYRPLW